MSIFELALITHQMFWSDVILDHLTSEGICSIMNRCHREFGHQQYSFPNHRISGGNLGGFRADCSSACSGEQLGPLLRGAQDFVDLWRRSVAIGRTSIVSRDSRLPVSMAEY
jgi:hypothetical protein